MTDPVISTMRLTLSRLEANDAPALYEYRSHPEVCRFQGFEPAALADAEEFINNLQTNAFDTAGTWFQFGIRLEESGLLIGDIGAHFTSDDPRQVEIGFTIAPQYQGRRFGTESVTGLIDFLLINIQKHRVFASGDPRNEPSVALLRGVGMRQEAHFRQSLWFKEEWVDDMVFAMLKSEWEGR